MRLTLTEALDLAAQMEVPTWGSDLSAKARAQIRRQVADVLRANGLVVPTWLGGKSATVEPAAEGDTESLGGLASRLRTIAAV